MKTLRLLLAFALALAPVTQALAGAGTITTKDAAGATRTFVVTTDGSGNFVSQTVICDATAAATCAAVDASGLAVKATQTGTWNITNVSGTISLPTGAATAANQSSVIGTKAPGTAATNAFLVGSVFNATPPAPTDGQQVAAQVDGAGNSKVALGTVATTLSGWTSGTSLNATQTLMTTANGAPAILLQLNQTSTLTVGAVTIEGTYDGTNWVTVPVAQVLNPNTLANLTNPYTLVASTNQPFLILTQGYQSVRIKLSTAITGTATVTPFVTLLNYNPTISGILNPLTAGSAIIGKVGIDQTTPGTTNGIRTTAGATGGGTLSGAIAPATPAGVNLKASAGTLFKVFGTTIQATPVYIKFYNSASAPTCGSGTPIGRFMVPVASTAANGAGTNIDIGDIGAAFTTGIGYCITGALPDADTTAITANNTLVNIIWN